MSKLVYNRLEEEETDSPRCEEPWLAPQESLVAQWGESAVRLSEEHDAAGKKLKKRNNIFGLPAFLIPMIMAPVSTAFKDEPFICYVEMFGYLASAITSGMVQFFNFSSKAEKHFSFAARYADLVTDIDQELSKPRKFRQQVDTFSLKVKMTYDYLNRGAPDL